ncbi:MAG: SLOG family protein [Anaerotignaceae bacterium]
MKNRTCCFTGHRRLSAEQAEVVKVKLKYTLTEMIKEGYLYFGAGGALGFDTLAALTVLELKKEYPRIKLILVLPCVNQTRGWNKKDVEVYDYIKSKCDKCVYTSRDYTDDCMLKRNRHLVDNSSLCICYLTRNIGGTAYTVRYARQKELKIINLAD